MLSRFARRAASALATRRPAAVRPRMARFMSSSSSLHEAVGAALPSLRERVQRLRKEHGSKVIGEVTINSVIGGMRGIKGLLTETSNLDAEEGIRFRGLSIPECQEQLPRAAGGEEPLPEGLLWLLLTGEVPTDAQVATLSEELKARSALPDDVREQINSYPRNMHAMTQLSSAVLALQPTSEFAAAYAGKQINKTNAWETTLEDSLNLIAKLPEIAAMIYRNKFAPERDHIAPDADLDWAANYAHMLGFSDAKFFELMRLYLTIHSDHEGGNVSAHATHLVGSALSDAYLSLSAGLNGLAGPLHGLANQEVLNWILDTREQYADSDGNLDKDTLRKACWDTLNSGRVIPGFGHAVLRKTDPRYTCQRDFALKHLPDDPLFAIVRDLFEVAPEVLTEHGKVANPWPNVDAHSGVLLQYYGLREPDYYTVLFGVSRALGVLASLTLDRGLGLPIERPKSLTLAALEKDAQE